MKLKTTLTVVVAVFGLLIAGCSNQKKSKETDESTTQSQTPSEEEESEMETDEKEKEGEEHPGKEKEGDEHPGDEKEGEEHPGDEKEGDEHPGDEEDGEEHPGDEAMNFNADDIKTAIRNHVDAESEDGIFTIQDEKEGKKLELEFVKIHHPVREMTEKGSYFGCSDFHVKGEEENVYDLDFWLKPTDGSLEVVRSKVHKHPEKKDGEWVKEARYTFKNNEVVAVE